MGKGHERIINTSIRKMAGTFKKDEVKFIWCEAVSYDIKSQTCVVTGENDVQIPAVALSAGVCDGLILFPTAGSQVVIAETINSPQRWVVLYSDIDSVILQTNAGTDGEIQLNDGSYGGLIQIKQLITKMNNLENLVNGLISKYNLHTHILTLTTGTGTAAVTANQETNSLTPTKQSDIENPLITHGK